jgi:hypothetical protein
MSDITLTDDGQVLITTKVEAQEYIAQKLMAIQMIQEQISSLQSQLQAQVTELQNLQGA